MTNEEIMMPRFKLLATYPMCYHEEGYIFIMPNYTSESTKQAWVEGMKKYPHLFQELKWWEGRSVFEMPRYLKNIAENMVHYGVAQGEVLKVDKYGPWDDIFTPTKFNKTYPLSYTIAASEEEYIAYIQQQTDKTE